MQNISVGNNDMSSHAAASPVTAPGPKRIWRIQRTTPPLLLTRLMDTYFGGDLDLHIQGFNLLSVIGVIAGLVSAIIGIFIEGSFVPPLIDFAAAVYCAVLLRIAEKKKYYTLCSWLLVTVIFLVLFPVLFFYCGGHLSGAICIFLIALIFTAILLERRARNIVIVFQFLLYLACILADYLVPEAARVLATRYDYLSATVLNFTATGAILLIVVLMRIRFYRNKRQQIAELIRELTARNEALSQYDQMKSDFLATLAHEINTPLAVISAGSSDTIDLLKETPLNLEMIYDNQAIIGKRVKLIDSILLDLMDNVAIESGRLSLNRIQVDLATLIRNTCDEQFKVLDENKNRLAYDLPNGLPELWADPHRIDQVLTNLLSNACRHTINGTIKIKLTQEDGRQIVSVIDDGEGMDAEMTQVVLKQYVSTKADFWRHGIGLYICRRIVKAHNGEIWIDSEKGRGTTISFSLLEEYHE